MVMITYIEADGTRHELDVAPGKSLMQAAVDSGIPGIIGECGGQMACGTCLVYVEPDWRQQTGAPGDMEEATLELHADDPTPGKRLSCQIKASDALEGLVVRMPESQY